MFVLIYCLAFVNAVLTLSRFSLICLLICQIAILYASGFNYFLKTMFKVLIGVVFTIAFNKCFCARSKKCNSNDTIYVFSNIQ